MDFEMYLFGNLYIRLYDSRQKEIGRGPFVFESF